MRHSLWIVCVALGKLSMALGVKLTLPSSGCHELHPAARGGRALDGVDAFPRTAAVRLLAAHNHQHIDSAFVAKLNFRRTINDAPVDFDIPVVENVSQ